MSKLLNIAQLCEMLSITREVFYERLRSGEIPPPIKRWGPPQWDAASIKKFLQPGDPTEPRPRS